jgi:hypothetical protein
MKLINSCERISAEKVFIEIKNDRDNEKILLKCDNPLGAQDEAITFQIFWVRDGVKETNPAMKDGQPGCYMF